MSLALEQATLIQENLPQGNSLPRHIAIIMDGNRRWQRKHEQFCQKRAISGHRQGADSIPQIVDTALHLGVEALTLFAFSTENFSRSKSQNYFLYSTRSCAASSLSYMIGRSDYGVLATYRNFLKNYKTTLSKPPPRQLITPAWS